MRGFTLRAALERAGLAPPDRAPVARVESQGYDGDPPRLAPPEPLRLSGLPSAGGLESLRERAVERPDDPVARVTGTMHWLHKSVSVLEIHGRPNGLLTPEEIVRMRRR